MTFFFPSFQNYQLFPGHLAEAHIVGPHTPPGSAGGWRFTESQQQRRNLPDPPSSRLPLSSRPRGLVSWRTPTPPANIAWLQGSVFPNLCNWMTHSNTLTRTHTHTRRTSTCPDACLATLWTPIHHAKIALTFKKCKFFWENFSFSFLF